jgi:hypothetical protein
MRRIVVTSLICSVLAFSGGYLAASRNTDELVAQHELVALMHYTPALAYLRKGQVDNAKNILYVGADGSIGTLSKNNAAALGQEDKESLRTTLIHLNQFWDQDKPFDTEKTASLLAIPGWVEMRRQNDAFRNGYASKQ